MPNGTRADAVLQSLHELEKRISREQEKLLAFLWHPVCIL